MSGDLVQRFPVRGPEGVHLRTWRLDLDALYKPHRRRLGSRDRLRREITDMAAHMPRWVLTLAASGDRLPCRKCGGVLVFDRGPRCVACGHALSPSRAPAEIHPAWFGLLPPIGIDSLARIKRGLADGAPDGHLVGHGDALGTFLLVPLLAAYPPGFPKQPPQVRYLPGFFQIPHIPSNTASHAYHLYGQQTMCLFACGEWLPETTCREVLEQRAYAHVIKMLNYANGKRSAFAKVS